MKPVVASVAFLKREATAELESRYQMIGPFKEHSAASFAADPRAKEARVLVSVGNGGTPADVLAQLPKLELVCVYGAGYDKVDIPALKARGIRLANGQGANAPCVADMAMALLMTVSLQVLRGDRLVKSGEWSRVPPKGWKGSRGFNHRRMGIFGMGDIGTQIARRAAGFDIEVGYHNRNKRDVPYRYFDNLVDLAAWADYLVVAAPLSDATRHRVNREVLRALGPDGFLVNIGRGAIIDEAALVEALKAGEIAGAGLDVLENEPKAPGELGTMDNVIITPHIAGVTDLAIDGVTQRLLANMEAFYTGKPLPSEVKI